MKGPDLAQIRKQLVDDLAHILLARDRVREARQQLGRHPQVLQVQAQALRIPRRLSMQQMQVCMSILHSKFVLQTAKHTWKSCAQGYGLKGSPCQCP